LILFKGKQCSVLLFYVLALIFSLWMAYWSGMEGISAVEEGDKPTVAVELFLYVLLFTIILIAALYFLQDWVRTIIFLLELFFLFATSLMLFSSLLGDTKGFIWALFLTLARALLRNFDVVRNLSVAVIAGVAAGVLGHSLSPAVALLFYVLLVVYDFVSVFVTKHMVPMVESVEGMKRSEKPSDVVALGGGDLVVPAIFATSFMKYSPFVAVASSLGAVLGVLFTLWMLKKLKSPLPALPYIGAVQITVTALALFLSTLLP